MATIKKELSIEEKARRYDEAIERAKNYYSTTDSADDIKLIGLMFPELRESEGERTRKELLSVVNDLVLPEEQQSRFVAWLEKQGEQKLYVNDNAKEMFIKALECVEEQNNKGYKLTDCDKNSWWEDFKAYTSCTIEQKPAAWSDEDEKQARQIERIVHDDGCTQKLQKQIADWFKSLKERCNWKPSDEQMDALHYVTNFDYGGHKATLVSLYEQLKKLKA